MTVDQEKYDSIIESNKTSLAFIEEVKRSGYVPHVLILFCPYRNAWYKEFVGESFRIVRTFTDGIVYPHLNYVVDSGDRGTKNGFDPPLGVRKAGRDKVPGGVGTLVGVDNEGNVMMAIDLKIESAQAYLSKIREMSNFDLAQEVQVFFEDPNSVDSIEYVLAKEIYRRLIR